MKIYKNIDDLIFELNDINKKIVFTNGCFDILHLGHLKLLRDASELGDILVVGLNSDKSVKINKGDSRPINNQNYRASMLEFFDFIDYIVLFNEKDPMGIIKKIRPDVLVKGGDYKKNQIIGAEFVEKSGGTVKIFKFVKNFILITLFALQMYSEPSVSTSCISILCFFLGG